MGLGLGRGLLEERATMVFFGLVWIGLVLYIMIWYGPATIVGLGRGGGEERAMMVRAALQSGPALPRATTASCGGSVRFVFVFLFVFAG